MNERRLNRKPRTTGLDMCKTCYAFKCDPFLMSAKFRNKIDKRREAGLCGACGNKECTCKRKMK